MHTLDWMRPFPLFPKSVFYHITNSFSVFGDSESFDIVHKLDAIMESKVEASSTYYHDGIKKYRAGNYKNYADNYLNEGYTTGDFAGSNCTTKDKDNFTIVFDPPHPTGLSKTLCQEIAPF